MSFNSRRSFLKLSLASLGSVYFPLCDPFAFAQGKSAENDPHFFVQFLIPGGMDSSYFFDGRPLDMKAKGLIQNYLNAEPALWNADSPALATSLVESLKAFRQNFSVINGVLMSSSFDGHDQNANLLLAGDPFGGESFIPHLNTATSLKPTPIDALQSGSILTNITNESKSIPLDVASMARLNSQLSSQKSSEIKAKVDEFVNSRYQKIGSGPGQFAETSHHMQLAFEGVPELAQKLINVKIDTTEKDPDIAFFKVAFDLFKQGVSRSAIFATGFNVGVVDVHGPEGCKKQPQTYANIISKIVGLMQTMKNTPFDEKRSFMDVTTFMVASEFGRTMKQMNLDVDATGTNHNPLSNSMLIGGKGVRGGLVIGSSDRASAAEKISKAHQLMDPQNLKIMGRPFDFAKGLSRMDLPDAFKAEDYLGLPPDKIRMTPGPIGIPAPPERSRAPGSQSKT